MSNIVEFKKPEKQNPPRPEKQTEPPLINLPPVTKYLLLVLIAVHIAITFGVSDEMRGYIMFNYGFTPSLWTGSSPYSFDFNALVSPVTYIFLHGSWMHLIMNGSMLMAFGAGMEKWLGGKKFLIFFMLCGIASALTEMIIHPASQYPIIGASGAESGLFAALLILLQHQGRLPTGRYGIWPFAVMWVGVSLLFGLAGGSLVGGEIAWAAHLGGFLAGAALLRLDYFRS